MKFFSLFFMFIGSCFASLGQVHYQGKIETGYLYYGYQTVMINPGPGWKGYKLNNEQNGISFTSINGVELSNNRIFTGAGVGYINFQGINGLITFGEIEFNKVKQKISPLFNFRIGYTHIWNQYPGGSGSALIDWSVGINYNIKHGKSIYVKTGFYITQQVLFLPLNIGFRF